jgi:hypothetical protein
MHAFAVTGSIGFVRATRPGSEVAQVLLRRLQILLQQAADSFLLAEQAGCSRMSRSVPDMEAVLPGRLYSTGFMVIGAPGGTRFIHRP